jgi:hypothetical protein
MLHAALKLRVHLLRPLHIRQVLVFEAELREHLQQWFHIVLLRLGKVKVRLQERGGRSQLGTAEYVVYEYLIRCLSSRMLMKSQLLEAVASCYSFSATSPESPSMTV